MSKWELKKTREVLGNGTKVRAVVELVIVERLIFLGRLFLAWEQELDLHGMFKLFDLMVYDWNVLLISLQVFLWGKMSRLRNTREIIIGFFLFQEAA